MENNQQLVKFTNHIESDNVKGLIQKAMQENAPIFVASLIELISADQSLQECEPSALITEAMKGASLKLSISKSLGQCYIIAYKKKPSFQLGYKGFIQMALRSGQYSTLNADIVYEGEISKSDKLKGFYQFDGVRKSDKVIGFFAYFELKNGFSKMLYMTVDQVSAHGKKYSPSFSYDSSIWKKDFNAMALKTVIKNLLSHYGVLSIELQKAFDNDVDSEIEENANKTDLTFTDAVVVNNDPTPAAQSSPEQRKPAF